MALFNRQWFPGLQRMFPSSTQILPYPRELTDTVSFTKDVQAIDFTNNVRMRRAIVTGIGTGAASISLALPEPEQGFFQLPVGWTAWVANNGGAALHVSAQIIRTANALDPWGAFETDTRSLFEWDMSAPGVAGEYEVNSVPFVFPVTRGFHLQVTFGPPNPVLNALLRTHFYYLDVPGDIVKLDNVLRLTQMPFPTAG